MNNAITVDTVSKYYKSFPALKDVSFTLEKGHVYGLLGENGAGKSTLCSILSASCTPDTGTVYYFSSPFSRQKSASSRHFTDKIGYLPQSPRIQNELTVSEYLIYSAACQGIYGDDAITRVSLLAEKYGMTDLLSRQLASLSTGNIKRAAICASVIHDPVFLILDEPSSALDPKQNVILQELISSRKNENCITLISSHNLYEIESLCDRIIIISNGIVTYTGDIDDLAGTDEKTYLLAVTKNASAMASLIRSEFGFSTVITSGMISIRMPSSFPIDTISSFVFKNGDIITHLCEKKGTLSQLYLNYTMNR